MSAIQCSSARTVSKLAVVLWNDCTLNTTPKTNKSSRKKASVKKVVLSAPKKKGGVTETVILGKGKYRKKSMKLGNSGIGATIGNALIPGVGGMLGHAAESLFKTIIGKGDYAEAENIALPLPENNTIMGLQSRPVTNEVAQMHWNGQATRIAHREYIGTISMSSGFAVAQYDIEPTSTFMFPWLSAISVRFQKYKLLGCVFEYVPTSATSISGGTPAVGQVALSINYNADSTVPSSLTNMLNNQGAVSARPFDTMICPVECDESLTPTAPLYIPRFFGPGTQDKRLSVFGQLIVATQGPAAYTNAGQLWITYDLQLIAAYIEPPAPPQLLRMHDEVKGPPVVTIEARPIGNQRELDDLCSCTNTASGLIRCPLHSVSFSNATLVTPVSNQR